MAFHERKHNPLEAGIPVAPPSEEDAVAPPFVLDESVGDGPSGPPPLYYDGGERLPEGIPIREDLVRADASDAQLSSKLKTHISQGKTVFFMPNDVHETNMYEGGRQVYRLHLFGALMNGAKAHVIVEDVPVFFDVRAPATVAAEQNGETFENHLRALLMGASLVPRIETVYASPVMGYHEQHVCWKRLSFVSLGERKKALHVIKENGYETASDDASGHHRKVAREQEIPLTDWLTLSDYEHSRGGDGTNSPLCEHVFRVKPAGIRALGDDVKAKNKLLSRDRTLMMTWDIETYTTKRTGELPDATKDDSAVFMIGCTFHWKDEAEPVYQVCLVDVPTEPDQRWTTVVCGSEENLLRAFGLLWNQLAPDYESQFNGMKYDWPFVVEKMMQYGILGWFYGKTTALTYGHKGKTSDNAYRWDYHDRKKVKISAEQSQLVSYYKAPGCVPIDVRLQFMKLYPKSEEGGRLSTSLNFYLRVNGLPVKVDLPHWKIWKIYEARDAVQMRHVAHYCMIDALSCQRLLVKRNVINDRREVSALSYTSLFDSLHYADGMRVCSMLTSYAIRRGFLCSSTPNEASVEKGKYPGAYVFHPTKGLHRRRPFVGLDFRSLYPSLIMTYNLSPEKYFETLEAVHAYLDSHPDKSAEDFHHSTFVFNGQQRNGWFLRHGNRQEDIGLYPSILIELAAKRAVMKDRLKVLEREKEELEVQLGEQERAGPCGAGGAESLADLKERHVRTSIEFNAVNSKQKALKVYMNTFYGETGAKHSPFRLLELAGGVTAAGQYNIKMVAQFVRDRNFIIQYGDTDSLYLSCPDEVFAELDDAYERKELTREEYWTKMVEVTMTVMSELRNEVNAHLRADNGCCYLEMAYEEVVFPGVLCGKKKYGGIAHYNVPNFHPKELFIKGIDVVKQGQTEIARRIGYRILWAAVSLEEDRSLEQIVFDVLREAVTNLDQWSFDDFVQSDAYRPDKDNKPVKRFIARMAPRHAREQAENKRLVAAGKTPRKIQYAPPEVGARFQYVIAKVPAFGIQGLKRNLTKGDRMEYADVMREQGMAAIDIPFYLKSYVVGQCARFINFSDRFQPRGVTDPKKADEEAQKAAKKELEKYVTSLYEGGSARSLGYAYRRAYAAAADEVYGSLVRQAGCPAATVLHSEWLTHDVFLSSGNDGGGGGDEGNPIGEIVKQAMALAGEAGVGEQYPKLIARRLQIGEDGSDLDKKEDTARQLYAIHARCARPLGNRLGSRNRHQTRTADHYAASALDRREAELRTALAMQLGKVQDIALKFDTDLRELVERFRIIEHQTDPRLKDTPNPSTGTDSVVSAQPLPGGSGEMPEAQLSLSEDDAQTLGTFRELWLKLAGVFIARKKLQTFTSYLSVLKNRRQRHTPHPSRQEISAAINEGARRLTLAEA